MIWQYPWAHFPQELSNFGVPLVKMYVAWFCASSPPQIWSGPEAEFLASSQVLLLAEVRPLRTTGPARLFAFPSGAALGVGKESGQHFQQWDVEIRLF